MIGMHLLRLPKSSTHYLQLRMYQDYISVNMVYLQKHSMTSTNEATRPELYLHRDSIPRHDLSILPKSDPQTQQHDILHIGSQFDAA